MVPILISNSINCCEMISQVISIANPLKSVSLILWILLLQFSFHVAVDGLLNLVYIEILLYALPTTACLHADNNLLDYVIPS